MKKIVREPHHFKYFTRCLDNIYFNVFLNCDMGWVDELQAKEDAERASRKKEGLFCFDREVYSSDPSSDYFPIYSDWPESKQEKLKILVRAEEKKVQAIARTGKIVKCNSVTLYLDCSDGNHYFSTPYFNYGEIYKAKLIENNSFADFDSALTAVYAFYNDWKDWDAEHGRANRAYNKELMLMAMSLDQQGSAEPLDSKNSDCSHEDLGSLGYIHGDIVICPHCNKPAEVW